MRLDTGQIAALKAQLARLSVEHRKLDARICRDAEGPYVDEVSVRHKNPNTPNTYTLLQTSSDL